MKIQLLAVEVDGFSQRVIWSELGLAKKLFQVSNGFRKREIPRKLDEANEVPAAAAAVAVEDILRSIDVEGGMRFRMERAQAEELGMSADRPRNPVLPFQVIQQRDALLERCDVLAHGSSRGRWRARAASLGQTPAPAGMKFGQRSGTVLTSGAVAWSIGRKGDDVSAFQEAV
jgi:hypothetical protein